MSGAPFRPSDIARSTSEGDSFQGIIRRQGVRAASAPRHFTNGPCLPWQQRSPDAQMARMVASSGHLAPSARSWGFVRYFCPVRGTGTIHCHGANIHFDRCDVNQFDVYTGAAVSFDLHMGGDDSHRATGITLLMQGAPRGLHRFRDFSIRLAGANIDWTKRYVGTITRLYKVECPLPQSWTKSDPGLCFIACEETHTIWQHDIWAYPSQVDGFQWGDVVTFKVRFDHWWNYPVAYDIEPCTMSEEQALALASDAAPRNRILAVRDSAAARTSEQAACSSTAASSTNAPSAAQVFERTTGAVASTGASSATPAPEPTRTAVSSTSAASAAQSIHHTGTAASSSSAASAVPNVEHTSRMAPSSNPACAVPNIEQARTAAPSSSAVSAAQTVEQSGAVAPSSSAVSAVPTIEQTAGAADGEDSNSRADVPARPGGRTWKRFSIPDGSGSWWWCEEDEDWFLESSPGEWAKYTDPVSERLYWCKADGDWFYC